MVSYYAEMKYDIEMKFEPDLSIISLLINNTIRA